MSGIPGLTHPMQHFAPPPPSNAPGAQGPPGPPAPWPDPFRDPYARYDPLQQLRFNPLMAAASYREEEERAKLYAAGYPGMAPPPPSAASSALRGKDPSPGPLSNLHMHHRAGPGPGAPGGSISSSQPQVRQLESMVHNATDLHKKDDPSQPR